MSEGEQTSGGDKKTDASVVRGWNRHIRDLGPSLVRQEGETEHNWLKRIRVYLQTVREKEYNHISPKVWFTHNNDFGCWICTLDLVAGLLLEYYEASVSGIPVSLRKDNGALKYLSPP